MQTGENSTLSLQTAFTVQLVISPGQSFSLDVDLLVSELVQIDSIIQSGGNHS